MVRAFQKKPTLVENEQCKKYLCFFFSENIKEKMKIGLWFYILEKKSTPIKLLSC